jgi:hypothetical protein
LLFSLAIFGRTCGSDTGWLHHISSTEGSSHHRPLVGHSSNSQGTAGIPQCVSYTVIIGTSSQVCDAIVFSLPVWFRFGLASPTPLSLDPCDLTRQFVVMSLACTRYLLLWVGFRWLDLLALRHSLRRHCVAFASLVQIWPGVPVPILSQPLRPQSFSLSA